METVNSASTVLAIVAPIIAAAATVIFQAAKATPEEMAKAKSWTTRIVLISLSTLIVAWFVIRLYQFASQEGPATRPEILFFALSLFNVLAYSSILIDLIQNALGQGRRAKLIQLQEELFAEREARLIAKASTAALNQLSLAMQGKPYEEPH